ncbi:MAG: carbohydrate-binding domain-containing protein [Janthinobacterium lividum]
MNTHLGSWDLPSWGLTGTWAGAEAKILAELQYIGVTNIRNSTPQGSAQLSEVNDFAKAGYKFELVQTATNGSVNVSTDVATLAALQSSVWGSVLGYEGSNEYNTNSYVLNGQYSYGNLAWGAYDDQVSRAALQANSSLSGVSYIAASTSIVSSAPTVGSYVDKSNWHVYAGYGQQLQTNMSGAVAAARATASGKPVVISEAGSSSESNGISWGFSGDEYTQAIIDTNAVLDAFNDGASQTFLYELMDDTSAGNLENNFGLFNVDGTAKQAAWGIHNLTTLLADSGTTASTFATSSMNFTLSGLPTTATDMLLQKSSGTYDLVLWNSGATVWNTATNTEAYVASSNVSVQLDGVHQTVRVYDLMSSTNAIQTFTNVSSFSVGLSKDPLIVEISSGTVGSVPGATQLGSGSNDLVLQMSEDAYQGDAQFTVSVDGTQIGGTQTAVASHWAGQQQEFDVLGNWSAGSHLVKITFLNDAYGGSAATDRNLYVNSATYNGSTVSNAASTLYYTGSNYFTMTGTNAIGTASTTTSGIAGSDTASAVTTTAATTYDYSDGTDHSLTTASGATDVFKLGGGTTNLTTQGNDTIIGAAGTSTITALSGSLSLTGGAGNMTFIQGAASSSVTMGSGAALIDIVNGLSGGSLTISDFVTGQDAIHLSGYTGTGIKSEQVVQGSTQILLTDNTQIVLTNFTSTDQSIFA